MNFKNFIVYLRQALTHQFKSLTNGKYNFNTILAAFAFVGIIAGLFLIYFGLRPPRTAQPITTPAASYYKNFIAGSGIIESKSENIQLGALVGGVVEQIYVKVGTKVIAGTPLFSLDARQARDDVAIQEAVVAQAQANLLQLEASLKDAKDKYQIAKNISDRRAISRDDFLTRENAYLIAQSAYETGKTNLMVAKANLKKSQTNLEILTIKAPIDCEVLQINVHPGEFAQAGPLTTPLMLIGNMSDIHVRINVDETDAWRFSPGASAIAYLRGNSAFRIDLEFDHLEPFVLPKTALTGEPTERVDVRVLQPIYKFKSAPPVAAYVGQQVDVFIEVPESLAYEKFFPKIGNGK